MLGSIEICESKTEVRQLILAFFLLWPASLLQDFEAGSDAYNRGDYTTAYRDWLSLAERGDAEARYNLGVMYEKGQGVPQDYAEAVKWYLLSAQQGVAEAQYNLGVMYFNGNGVRQNYVTTYAWVNLAAAQGNKDAVKNLEIVQERMTPAQVAKGQKLSRELYERLTK